MGPQDDDLAPLERAFQAAEQDARAVVDGLSEAQGTWRAHAGSWNIAECLDHLATGNRIYLGAMQPAAERALAAGRYRREPVRPGLVGAWFVRSLEPPVKTFLRMRSPRKIRPRPSPPLADAMDRFLTSQREILMFMRSYAKADLTGVLFPNPFIRGLRFSLATGLHVLAAHERRHLWQAWRVRRMAERCEQT
jgi:hypothetical protein